MLAVSVCLLFTRYLFRYRRKKNRPLGQISEEQNWLLGPISERKKLAPEPQTEATKILQELMSETKVVDFPIRDCWARHGAPIAIFSAISEDHQLIRRSHIYICHISVQKNHAMHSLYSAQYYNCSYVYINTIWKI